jgi:hypothetical protein
VLVRRGQVGAGPVAPLVPVIGGGVLMRKLLVVLVAWAVGSNCEQSLLAEHEIRTEHPLRFCRSPLSCI